MSGRVTSCPDQIRLRELLDRSLPDDEQAELIGHLDGCKSCQRSLEELAGDSSLTQAALHVAEEQPPQNSAYWRALQQLGGDAAGQTRASPHPTVVEEVSLDFLSPAEDPQYLGRLSHFEVVQVIGHGGMGVVLKGFDPCLERHVALKVLDPQFANNQTARKRFCREARAAASITHENVVAVHQVEREEGSGLPFLVMQLVEGESLEDRLAREGPLPLQDIIRIGAQAASGLAAAHARGLIHRDIKPANILLESHTRVRLTDFGLARAFDDVKLTQTGFVAGTPLYMSPEQARGEEADHRADLFSLGGVLYAMCTGKAPFEGSTPYIILKRVTEESPRPIREVNPEIPECLAHGIHKLLAKDPVERYQSAAEVAEMLGQWSALLQHPSLPKVPCPEAPSSGLTLRQRVLGRPNRYWLTLAILPWLLMAGLAVSEYSGFTGLAGYLAGPAVRDETRPASRPPRATFDGNNGPVWSAALSPDSTTLAMAQDDGTVRLWDVASDQVRETLRNHRGPVWTLAFSPDGRTLATGCTDMTVRLWDMPAGTERRPLKHSGSVRSLAIAHHSPLLVSGSRDGAVKLWNLETGDEPVHTEGHTGEVLSVAFALDDKTIASASGDHSIKLWDVSTGKERLTIPGRVGVYAVAFSPDGKTLASGGWDKQVHLWDVASGNQRDSLIGHTQDIWSLAFSPDGKTLATGSEDRTVKLWDVDTGQVRETLEGHTASVYTVSFSPDGSTLITGGRDGTIKLWDVPSR
jgi:serine/threonine protein kinase